MLSLALATPGLRLAGRRRTTVRLQLLGGSHMTQAKRTQKPCIHHAFEQGRAIRVVQAVQLAFFDVLRHNRRPAGERTASGRSLQPGLFERGDMKEHIFVFGSNLAGRHGKGSAKEAFMHHGAVYGQGVGLQGRSYAIPTKDKSLKKMPLHDIEPYVSEFMGFAREHPEMTFDIVAIGCGLAGYTPEQIAPMFRGVPENCRLPQEFMSVLAREQHKQHTTNSPIGSAVDRIHNPPQTHRPGVPGRGGDTRHR